MQGPQLMIGHTADWDISAFVDTHIGIAFRVIFANIKFGVPAVITVNAISAAQNSGTAAIRTAQLSSIDSFPAFLCHILIPHFFRFSEKRKSRKVYINEQSTILKQKPSKNRTQVSNYIGLPAIQF